MEHDENDRVFNYKISYFLVVLSIGIGLVFLILNTIRIPSQLEYIIVTVAFIGIFYFCVRTVDSYLDIVLSEEKKNELGFFKVKWRSKDFDKFVGSELIELYQDSNYLFEFFSLKHSPQNNIVKEPSVFTDHSFMLIPIAKVYEGVLKKILAKSGVIQDGDLFENPSINVGAYFNPAGNDKISCLLKDKARDKVVPHVIYSTYQECRNQIFHYDQYRDRRIKTVSEAEFYRKRILDAIYKAYDTFCKQ